MKKYAVLSLILAFAMLFSVMAGCSSSKPAESEEPAASEAPQEAPAADAEEAPGESEEAPAEEPASEFTGAVVSKDECAANGYDVKYGMYDFETYVELPMTTEGESLSYWMGMQPFMAMYSVDMAETTYFKEMEERTGVKIDVTAVSTIIASEQYNLIIASGDMTDIMDGTAGSYSGGITKAIEDEVYIDLTDEIEAYMPNYKAWLDTFPEMRAIITNLDGTIGTAGSIGSGIAWNIGTQIRGDWLEELGLEKPVTYDEYYEVLKAFKTEYGGTLWLDANGSVRNSSYAAGYDVIYDGTGDIRCIDNVMEYVPVTQDFKDYLTLINKWHDEGLIYPDFLAQTSVSTPDNGLIMNNEVGIWVSDADTMSSYDKLSDEIVVEAISQPRKEYGQQLHVYQAQAQISDGVSISTNCENVELACKWLDYNYTYDGMLLNCYGVEGESMQFNENGEAEYTELVTKNPDMILIACVVVYSRFGGAGVFNTERFSQGYEPKYKEAVDLWLTDLDNAYHPSAGMKMTTEDSERISVLYSEISTYAEQCIFQFITGEMSIEDQWDEYVANIESLGLEEMMELYNDANALYVETLANL